MLGTVVMLTGFVLAVLAILGFTPALERWATSAPRPADTEAQADYGKVVA